MADSVTFGPTFYSHVQRFYAAMHDKAKSTKVNDDEWVTLYQGRVTRLFYGLNLPSSYYGAAMAVLKLMGCVTVISRGAGKHTESEIALHYPPSPDLYAKAVKEIANTTPAQRRNRALKKARQR